MALSDYRLCDVCGGKAFCDANLTYEDAHDEWPRKRAAVPYRVAGVEQVGDTSCLGYVGDWAVIAAPAQEPQQPAANTKEPT